MQIVLEEILACRDRGFYKLHAFAIMPDHLHIPMTSGEGATSELALNIGKPRCTASLIHSVPMLVERVEEYDCGSASGRYALDCSRFDRD